MAIIISRLLGGSEVFLENKLKQQRQSDCQAAHGRSAEALRSQRKETMDLGRVRGYCHHRRVPLHALHPLLSLSGRAGFLEVPSV